MDDLLAAQTLELLNSPPPPTPHPTPPLPLHSPTPTPPLNPRRPAEAVQSIICREFGRSSLLVHNGIDCQRFRPGLRDEAALAAPTRVLGPPASQVRRAGGF